MAPALFKNVTVSVNACDVVRFVATLCTFYQTEVIDSYQDHSLFVITLKMGIPKPLCFFTNAGAVLAWTQ